MYPMRDMLSEILHNNIDYLTVLCLCFIIDRTMT